MQQLYALADPTPLGQAHHSAEPKAKLKFGKTGCCVHRATVKILSSWCRLPEPHQNIHMLLSPLLSQLTTNASMHWAFTHKIKCNHDCTVGLHNFYFSYLVFLFVCFLWIKLLPKYPHASFSSPLLALKNASMNCTGHSCTIKCNYEFAGMSEKLVGTNFCIVYYL